MQRLDPFQGWRLTFFQAIIFAVFLLFSVQMYRLQIVETENYQLLADDNRLNELPLSAPRGVIFDRYGRVLANNVPAFNVTIIPAALPADRNEELSIFNRLSALVDVPPTAALAQERQVRSIEELVAEGEGIEPYRPVVVATDIDPRAAMQIMEQRISMPGVDIEPVGVREYPTAALTAQVVGYMGPISAARAAELRAQGYNPAFDRVGYSGIEFSLESTLSGQRGSVLREVDVAGRVVREIRRTPSEPGQNVRLTIDNDLQQAAETALTNRISLLNATEGRIRTQSGVVIAMDPRNGEILAMVSWPTYDNSRFARTIDYQYYLEVASAEQTPLVNHAISSLYPPGSVWKLITGAGVLEENVIAPETTLFDAGRLVLPNRYAPNDEAASQTFVCWDRNGHGALNMIGAIALSCDVYFYQVGGGNPEISPQTLAPGGLGPIGLFRHATAVGIGSQLGVEVPGELGGRMPDPDWKRRIYGENWSTGDTYNAAFGQGYVTTTPLQLLASSVAILNGGTLYQPTLINSLLDAEGNVVQAPEPLVIRDYNIDNLPPDEPITLLLLEDMIMQGASSLACTCEPTSPFYNALRCDPDNYVRTVNISSDPFIPEMREYTVQLPPNYSFNSRVCTPNRFNDNYRPAFVSSENLRLVQEGMRVTVTEGTARPANLPYIAVAGKTGTAEYCDDVARPLGLCVPGNWPAHAWFFAYAPFEDPEIAIIAFVYNGGEGSQVALPIVVETLEAYLRLQNERGDQRFRRAGG